ncbi:uncharacterized protein LOC110448020 isoform X2 [Mizuhopecten yessoensis]|uniref:uncharacterized protein LOC110448020 isoform X2 n=1 Tax=Mizuhopecten yessoensis TaxID=6573 RepID=UPI000B459C1D|nr:uncharacterized protein LOC110448020 isoform X2 [Mizuhopecten yessoensis]
MASNVTEEVKTLHNKMILNIGFEIFGGTLEVVKELFRNKPLNSADMSRITNIPSLFKRLRDYETIDYGDYQKFVSTIKFIHPRVCLMVQEYSEKIKTLQGNLDDQGPSPGRQPKTEDQSQQQSTETNSYTGEPVSGHLSREVASSYDVHHNVESPHMRSEVHSGNPHMRSEVHSGKPHMRSEVHSGNPHMSTVTHSSDSIVQVQSSIPSQEQINLERGQLEAMEYGEKTTSPKIALPEKNTDSRGCQTGDRIPNTQTITAGASGPEIKHFSGEAVGKMASAYLQGSNTEVTTVAVSQTQGGATGIMVPANPQEGTTMVQVQKQKIGKVNLSFSGEASVIGDNATITINRTDDEAKALMTGLMSELKQTRDGQYVDQRVPPKKSQKTSGTQTSGDLAAKNVTIANASHAKKIHSDLEPMIETTKANIREGKEKKFYHTKGFRDAKDKLQKNRVVVIKGNTGDGKTAIAVQLLHWLSQEQGAGQPLQLPNIEKLDLLTPNLKLITFIDDIFGEKDVCKKDVQEWNRRVSNVKTLFLGEQTETNFLLITVRNEVFNSLEKRSMGTIFTKDNLIDLSSDTYKAEEEKKRLLELYKPENFSWTDKEKTQILTYAPNIGFPQCCQLFYNSEELQKERVRFFAKPFHFLNEALTRLQECSALLFLFLNDSMISVKDLDQNSQNVNQKLLEEAFEINLIDGESDSTKLTWRKKIGFVKESLEKLVGVLVVKEKHLSGEDVYRFNHDSIYVAVALLYGKVTPIGFIQNCPSKSLSYLTTSKTATNMIVIASNHYTEMCERLLREFECKKNQYGTSIGSLDVWNDPVFVKSFVGLLNDRRVDKLDVLNKASYWGAEECALYLLCEGVEPDEETVIGVVEGGSVKVLRKLLEYDVIPTARDKDNNNVLHEACVYEREEMVTLLCDTYPHLVHDTDMLGRTPLYDVALTGNCSMFQTMERCVLNSLYRVDDQQHKCESVNGRVVHRNCVCAQYMAQLVDDDGRTVLHVSCMLGKRELCLYLCRSYPALTTAVDKYGWHCLHYLARFTSDVDLFTECESHVKQYLESTGRKYDITTILDKKGSSVLEKAKETAKNLGTENNPLLDHLIKVFGK